MKTFCFVATLLLLISCTNPKGNIAATTVDSTHIKDSIATASRQTGMKQIQLESPGCYGTCPQFTLTVQQDGTARYDAREHNERQGQFTTTIKKPQMDSLVALVNASNYFSLKDDYPAMVTDVVQYKSTLTLQNDSSKTISDHGPSGPASLKALYKFMLSLRTSQDWR